MAPKHGEVTRKLSDGWTLGWDSTEIDPALRAATNRVVRDSVASLKKILEEPSQADDAPKRRASRGRAIA